MGRWLLALALMAGTAGCGSGYYVVSKDDNPEVIWYDATRRAQIVIPVFSQAETLGNRKVAGYKVVCEPPPDSVMQTSLKTALSGKYTAANMTSVEIAASLELQRTALLLASRTERVELLRDALFSLNLSTVNLQASPSEYHASYLAVVRSVLQSTLSDSAADAAQASTRAQELASESERQIAELQAAGIKSDDPKIKALQDQRDRSLKIASGFQESNTKLNDALRNLSKEETDKPKAVQDETVVSLLKGQGVTISALPRLWAFGDAEADKTISSEDAAKTALVDGIVSKELKKNVGLFWSAGYHGKSATEGSDKTAYNAQGIVCTVFITIPATLKGDKGKDKRLSVVIRIDESQRAFNPDKITLAFTTGTTVANARPVPGETKTADNDWKGGLADLPDDARPDHKTWEVSLPVMIPIDAKYFAITLEMTAANIEARDPQSSGIAISEIYAK